MVAIGAVIISILAFHSRRNTKRDSRGTE
jgi:hypothetical protein